MAADRAASRRFVLAGGLAAGAAALGPAARAQAPLKVAAIHAEPVANAWNARLHQAMREAAAEGRIDYVFSEAVAAADYPRAMRDYAAAGHALIVGEAYAVEREAREVAARHPGTAFLMGSSGEPAGSNFGTFGTWNHEGAYLCGMLAGAMTQSGIVGSVGAMPIAEVNMQINAFAAGVAAVNPQVRHRVAFIGTFYAPARAREAGLALIDAGADILFGERIGTADAARDRGVRCIGALIDYTARYPGTVFANALWYFRPLLDAALAAVAAGRPVAGSYTRLGRMREGGSAITYVPAAVPAAAAAAMEARRAAILAGTFEVAADPRPPG